MDIKSGYPFWAVRNVLATPRPRLERIPSHKAAQVDPLATLFCFHRKA